MTEDDLYKARAKAQAQAQHLIDQHSSKTNMQWLVQRDEIPTLEQAVMLLIARARDQERTLHLAMAHIDSLEEKAKTHELALRRLVSAEASEPS